MYANLYIASAAIILLGICIYLLISLSKKKAKLTNQTAKLVQLYLDKQFITKILRMLVYSNDNNEMFTQILKNIKEYFELDDVIFYNLSDKPGIELSPKVFGSNNITQYVNDNQQEIVQSLEFNKVFIKKVTIQNRDLILYIVGLEDESPNTLVLFIQYSRYSREELNSHDLDTLSNAIRVVLSDISKHESVTQVA